MPEGGKCSDYEYEQYGFENKQFSLEHSMVSRLQGADHDLSVIDEIPYLDEVQPQFAYVTEHTTECDEVLTIYKICSSDDLLTVKEEPLEEEEQEQEEDEEAEAIQGPSQHLSVSEHTEPGCSSVEHALNEYVKNAPSDISVNIESSDLKTDICTVIERADSMELLSGSSGTIRSGSTVTGYDFDTVKNLNLDSCSTSKLSLSLKSEGFDEFTLTPDEPKIVRNCDAEDFTLTPEASFNELVPLCLSTIEEPESDVPLAETLDQIGETNQQSEVLATESTVKTDDDSISSNEVVMIVDKFLAGERLLQQNLSIIPVDVKSFTSPLISPIDSDGSSTNALIEKQKSILFNLQSSSSKSTLDDAIDLEKINFDEDYEANDDQTGDKEVSTFTTEITKEFDLLFSRAEDAANAEQHKSSNDGDASKSEFGANSSDGGKMLSTPTTNASSKDTSNLGELEPILTPKPLTSPMPTRMPTRYSMQRLEPYFFSDDVTGNNDHAKKTGESITPTAPASTPTTNAPLDANSDYCKMLDTNDGSFLQKKILSKLKKNKSQSLGNLNKKSRCFPL